LHQLVFAGMLHQVARRSCASCFLPPPRVADVAAPKS